MRISALVFVLSFLAQSAFAQLKMRPLEELINKEDPGWPIVLEWIDSAWENWRKELSKLAGDRVYNFFPPLWTKEGKAINKSSRKAVPVEEQFSLNLEFQKQLGIQQKRK